MNASTTQGAGNTGMDLNNSYKLPSAMDSKQRNQHRNPETNYQVLKARIQSLYHAVMDRAFKPEKNREEPLPTSTVERNPYFADLPKVEHDGHEGGRFPEYIKAIIEGGKNKKPGNDPLDQNGLSKKKKDSSYGDYDKKYVARYDKEKKPKTPYLKLIEGGNKLYSNEPADNVAAKVEKELSKKDYQFQPIRKAAKTICGMLKSVYSTALKQYENIKRKGYASNENPDETESQYVDNVVNIADFREPEEESDLELLLKAA